jgi:hypothetical protein
VRNGSVNQGDSLSSLTVNNEVTISFRSDKNNLVTS